MTLLKPDEMENVNKITGLDIYETDNWVDYYEIKSHKKLYKYVSKEEIKALKNGEADYIAFRIDG